MTCQRCLHLVKPERFATPRLLKNILAVIRANVAGGTLLEDSAGEPTLLANQPTFADLDDAHWPDVFIYKFRCSGCGARFELTAETFHGAGGLWSRLTPVSDGR